MLERFSESQTWVIVFDKCYSKHWWKHLLHPAFQHVFLMRSIGDETLIVNSLSHITAISHSTASIEDYLASAQDCTAILMLTVHYGSHYKVAPMDILTCVSVAKRILGIRSHLITPYALYKELIRAGATIIKPFAIIN